VQQRSAPVDTFPVSRFPTVPEERGSAGKRG